MTRLTDERLAEILRPKDIIGETELELLAREVRELRAVCGHYKSLVEYDADIANRLSAKVEQLTRERDAAREFCRRLFDTWKAMIGNWHTNWEGFKYWEFKFMQIREDYDASQTPQPQPPQTEWVPWTSATRPMGVVLLRPHGFNAESHYAIQAWLPTGLILCQVEYDWGELFKKKWEWSRDGVTWQPCGTEVAR